jgi:hypothetical protein
MATENKDPQQAKRVTNDELFNLLYKLADIHVSAIATLIRRDFGTEALGFNSFWAMVLIFVMYAATADQAMLAYLGIWLFCQVMQRARTFRLIRGGAILHSRYPGYPYVAMLMPFVRSQVTAKGIVEPIICLLGGAFLCSVSINLGGFIMLGFLTFMIRNGIEQEIRRKRLERMRDAEIEQRWYSDAHKHGMDE